MDSIKKFAAERPRTASWVVLAIGMVIIVVWSASDVGFTASQWTALIITTVLMAGLCAWIIGWEDDDELEDDLSVSSARAQPDESPAEDKA